MVPAPNTVLVVGDAGVSCHLNCFHVVMVPFLNASRPLGSGSCFSSCLFLLLKMFELHH